MTVARWSSRLRRAAYHQARPCRAPGHFARSGPPEDQHHRHDRRVHRVLAVGGAGLRTGEILALPVEVRGTGRP